MNQQLEVSKFFEQALRKTGIDLHYGEPIFMFGDKVIPSEQITKMEIAWGMYDKLSSCHDLNKMLYMLHYDVDMETVFFGVQYDARCYLYSVKL